jgi:flagellin-like protein
MRLDTKLLRKTRRRGVSEVIAILLLVVIVLVAVGVVLAFGVGVINDLIAGGVSTPLTASGQMVVPGTTSDHGVLTLSIRNSQGQSIYGIVVTCPSSFSNPPPPPSCVPMNYNNNLIAAANPVPSGQTSVGSAPVTSGGAPFVAGNTYSILMAVTFATGSEITLDVSVTAVS